MNKSFKILNDYIKIRDTNPHADFIDFVNKNDPKGMSEIIKEEIKEEIKSKKSKSTNLDTYKYIPHKHRVKRTLSPSRTLTDSDIKEIYTYSGILSISDISNIFDVKFRVIKNIIEDKIYRKITNKSVKGKK